jgi:hypothetical protein
MLNALGLIVPLAFSSGINLYATVGVLGLCSHYGLVSLPEQLRVLDNPIIITAALGMYLVEFIADKIPWVDSMWDAVHTVVRPLGGALIAVTALTDASPTADALAALLGGSIAMTTHLTKTGTRAAANTSPEPFSNWLLSLGEDLLAVGISYGAVQQPMIALTIAIVLLIAILVFASLILRFVRRRFRRVREAFSSSHA